ncbi:putative receptor-type tyrosine-protein phosphatase mosPTP-1 isoform X2 [Babylonia areolata]|uniref:putative receptor-type tyrosine-protein phosphatase mosPTP-1 isoform X2 n=1 Tax=Babylonia areolata TaxID=304850 RepID=UPI003FD24147
MRPLLLQLLLLLGIFISSNSDGTAGETLIHRKGDNVTLTCVEIRDDEQFGGVLWYKGTVFQVSMDSVKKVTYATDPSVQAKVTLEEDHSLTVMGMESTDTDNYTCQLFVLNTTLGQTQTNNRSATWRLVVQDVPSAPGQAQLEDVQARQVTMHWAPSDSDNYSPISSYIVEISETNSADDSGRREVVVAGMTLKATVQDLTPVTCYRVRVRARNGMGRGPPGPTSEAFCTKHEGNLTTAGPPSAPPDMFQAISPSNSDIRISWQPPQMDNPQEIKGYKVIYSQRNLKAQTIHVEDPTETSLMLQGLEPFTWYTVSILAYNDKGDGPVAELAVQTLEGVPSSPRITHITDREATSFYVHWEPPKRLSGRLTAYELHWTSDDNITKTRIISGHLTNPMSAFITGLQPYTEYKIQVAAFTGGGRGKFSEKYPALTDTAAPSAPYIRNVTVLSPNSVFLQWDPPAVFYRRVDKYVLNWRDTRGNEPDTMVPGTKTQHILKNLQTNMRYELKVAGVTQAIFSKQYLVGKFTEPVTFMLGDPNVQENKGDGVPTEIVAGVTCALIVVIVIVASFIAYRSLACQKCYQAAYYYLAVPSNMQPTPPTVIMVAEPSEDKEYPEVPVNQFPAHVDAMHADSDFAFSQEFEDLYRNTRTDFKCEASNMPENRSKNRYINIAAFDHSRVMLKNDAARLRQADYINANYVDGYQKPKAYIATQGPLPQTFADFWRMVWEQNCSVIVMITNLMEKGRRKCDQYWPSDGVEIYGNMSVKLLSTVQRAHYTVNIFSLRNLKVKKRHSMKGVTERTVYQYHYTEWPDHGVPDYTLPVLEFVQKSAACNPPDGGPIVVHCSAGVGRTGTYILIDSMIRKIGDQGTVNIPGFTLHIRRQRNLLVQTEDQYMFIHDALVEYLMGGGQTEITDESIPTYVASLTSSSNGVVPHDGQIFDTCSMLEKQFKLATVYLPSEDDMSCALKAVNCEKNRNPDFVPVNLKRVILPARPGIEGSEYINATYLQGYRKSDEFILTQYPLESTKEDFWRMVWDRNSPVIIVLTSPDDEEFVEFWPEKGNSVEVDAGNFKLSMRDDPVEEQDCVTREFILESIQYDYIFMTKVVKVNYWPDTDPPQHNIYNLIEAAIDWQRANDIGPVIIMDRDGGVRAGRFCALWALRDQLILDKVVDVYQLVKLYHLKRPGIVGSQDDLLYLYKALACLRENLQVEDSVSSSSPRHHTASIRKNGTLPRSSTLQNSSNKNETNI